MAGASLEHLQAMIQRALDVLQRHGADLRDIKHRLTAVELQVGQLVATKQSHYVATMARFDQIEGRLDRLNPTS